MSTEHPITDRQREILAHTIARDHRMERRNRKRPWNDDGLRNRYCVAVGGDNEMAVTDLISRGLMEKGETMISGQAWMAYATEAGVNEVMPKKKGST